MLEEVAPLALFNEPSKDNAESGGNKDRNAFDLSREDGVEKPEAPKLSLLNLTGTGIKTGEGIGNAEGDNPNFLKGFELTESSLDKYYDNAMDPQWNRLRQGRIPDCHFVASLQSVSRNPHGKEELADLCTEVPGHQDQRDHRQQGNKRKIRVGRDHHSENANSQEDEAHEFGNRRTGKTLDGAHILDTARNQLTGLGMVVIRERQVLDVIVHAVTQVITDVRRHPLRGVTVAQTQQGGDKPQRK